MYKITILVFLILFCIKSYAQDSPGKSKVPIDSLEETMPCFPGGDIGLNKYMRKNLNYPLAAREDNVEGEVQVGFAVNEYGKVDSVVIVKGVRADLDSTAKKLVLDMPVWKPGIMKGKPVRVKFILPITFKLK